MTIPCLPIQASAQAATSAQPTPTLSAPRREPCYSTLSLQTVTCAVRPYVPAPALRCAESPATLARLAPFQALSCPKPRIFVLIIVLLFHPSLSHAGSFSADSFTKRTGAGSLAGCSLVHHAAWRCSYLAVWSPPPPPSEPLLLYKPPKAVDCYPCPLPCCDILPIPPPDIAITPLPYLPTLSAATAAYFASRTLATNADLYVACSSGSCAAWLHLDGVNQVYCGSTHVGGNVRSLPLTALAV